jgi:hypothetical protein
MTTINATPLKVDFQKEMHPSNMVEKVSNLLPNPTPHCCPCQMHQHQNQRERIAHLNFVNEYCRRRWAWTQTPE